MHNSSGLFLTVTTAMLAIGSKGAEIGLVAHYTFDEGSGTVLRDVSGNGNDGQIHGARYVRRGEGYCLEFNGVDQFVDCGHRPSLDLREAVTLEAWVFPANRVQGEPGILGKHFSSYLLTYYSDGRCWWYITEGGNHCKNFLTTDSWHHVVGTFDGTTMNLYVDGRRVDTHTSQFAQINPGKNFYLGCVVGDPTATDPAYTPTTYFPGQMDEVRVYNRALSEAEVQAHFQAGVQNLALMASCPPVRAVATLRAGKVSVKVGKQGSVQVDTGKGSYVVESAYSYPGEKIGWNSLAETEVGSESGWSPRVRKAAGSAVAIEARGRFYHLRRTVKLEPGKVRFEDRLTHVGKEPVGLIVRHRLTAPQPFQETFTPGGAENPTIFLAAPQDRLGVLVEDNLSRLRFEPGLGLPNNQARFRVSSLGLDAGRSYTLRWTLYLLDQGADYFDLVNQVRRDWKTNFTLEGPFSFFDVGSPLLDHPQELQRYLERRQLRIVALSPWLDYDPGSFDRVWTRDEYKARMQKALQVFRQADPTIQCVGCIETDWVTIYPEKIPGGDQLPAAVPGQPRPNGRLTPEQTRIIDEADLPWKDSVKRDAQGNLELELYVRGGQPQTALSVYPAVGNYQYEFLLGQVQFLLHEVGLDGFYIDEFSQGWYGGIHTYSGGDGWSVDLDPRTGQIQRKYVDCSLAGVQARVNLCQYALQRGKVVIANTYATAQEEQSLPVQRFSETWGSFDPFAVADGVEPPAFPDLFRGNLATPIGLGITGAPRPADTARWLMKAVVTYLRHGAVYYHYRLEDLPESGPGSGEYGPINHTFPITPRGLHKGWIEGEERTITCVSGRYLWRHKDQPTVHLFDLEGREKPHHFALSPSGQGWKVEINLRDWAEIAVISKSRKVLSIGGPNWFGEGRDTTD